MRLPPGKIYGCAFAVDVPVLAATHAAAQTVSAKVVTKADSYKQVYKQVYSFLLILAGHIKLYDLLSMLTHRFMMMSTMRTARTERTLLAYLAQRECQLSTRAPAAPQADLKHRASYSGSIGGDVHHVSYQGKTLHTRPGHISL